MGYYIETPPEYVHPRPKTWLVMDREEAVILSGFRRA